ncbi:hybrid sensor histidine kinase/response regulator [Pulveribacter suum]|uniref:histidine kinase n=1 Tax=Pulveribacter suum TaxID=2116657 RepID=A0A2P1NQ18_9BURK|nr:hybrid sensor histidine kinase/response regulator [Pulveribacter suum]AVP59152.1 hybrid sensor histidine kinase/response regulator [Pulveribacter suum]
MFANAAKPTCTSGACLRQGARVRCLLVDDVPQNLVALEALLQGEDVDILKADSGAAALELLLQENDIALALLDVQMPEMNGFELAELIRGAERTRHIPLIFMTAGAHDQRRQFKGYESGAVDFLYKPIDPHMLINKARVFFDLHRQKHALACELQQRTEALYINEMFMAVLGHDLRTPLSAILASTSVLQRPLEPAKVQVLAGKAEQAGRRMLSMIEDLLDVTRARQNGGLVMLAAPTDLAEQAERVLQEVRAGHPQRELQLQCQGDLHGSWDGERLGQMLANLLGNAMHHGTPQVPVQLQLDGEAADGVTVCVTNGGEIPQELLPRLFEPFRGRTSAAGSGHNGLGLGLFIVHQIVQAHGGRITATSQGGRTCFTVWLPRRAQQQG